MRINGVGCLLYRGYRVLCGQVAALSYDDVRHLGFHAEIPHPAALLQLSSVHMVKAAKPVLGVPFPVAFVTVTIL
jgi:hypothetical protein